MTLLLVRHAIALRRSDWTKPDDLRPLTPKGYQQADGLPDVLAPFAIARILSSPSLRCRETVQPLGGRLALPVEEVPFLAEGSGSAATGFLDQLDEVVVLCSHGDVIPDLLAVLAPAVVDDDLPCAKGSTWVVERDGSATYLPPPSA